MKSPAILACIVLIAVLDACTSAPPVRHLTLDDGRPRMSRSSTVPSIAVIRADVPEFIDRPQLMLRTDGHEVTFSEQYRWAEPLRREIPRVIANDLAELLDSSRIAALPAEDAGFTVDFKLVLDFQKLDTVVGKGVDIDVLWRIEPRGDKAFIGRSSFRQPLAGMKVDVPTLVVAQRQALRRVAVEITQEIVTYQKRCAATATGLGSVACRVQ